MKRKQNPSQSTTTKEQEIESIPEVSCKLPPPSAVWMSFQTTSSSPNLIPVNLPSNVLDKLCNEPLTTRKEREPLNFENFRSMLEKNCSDLTDSDIEAAFELRSQQHETFLNIKARDRKVKIRPVKELFPYLTNEEIIEMMNEDDEEVNNYFDKIVDWGYLVELRKRIALVYTKGSAALYESQTNSQEPSDEVDNSSAYSSDESAEYTVERNKKKKKKAKQSRNTPLSDCDSISETNSLSDEYVPSKCAAKRKKSASRKNKRLKLDEAILSTDTFEGWSEARVKAYKSISTNPNAYYYRFNSPGVPQRHGAWSQEEHELFLERLRTFDMQSPKWGIFSQSIPGRVGYQCANYYRHLVKEGLIQDPNYVLEKGKLRMKKKEPEAKEEEPPSKFTQENPLPNFIDCITHCEVVNPYLSPYGHVLGYETWRRILNPTGEDAHHYVRNQCPFTKKKLTKRNLIQLTKENIEQYRSKIIGL